jgi:site-specific recombinase
MKIRLPANAWIASLARLVYALGPERRRRVADWFDQNVAGLGGTVSFGVLLGMIADFLLPPRGKSRFGLRCGIAQRRFKAA